MELEILRNEIKTRGLKRRWIAEKINVHPSTLTRFLAGKSGMRGEAMLKLLQLLDLSPKRLKAKAS